MFFFFFFPFLVSRFCCFTVCPNLFLLVLLIMGDVINLYLLLLYVPRALNLLHLRNPQYCRVLFLLLLEEILLFFSRQRKLLVIHLGRCDDKSSPVTLTLLSILSNLIKLWSGAIDSQPAFQFLQTFFLAFGDCSKLIKYNWYNRHCHYSQFFLNSQARS